MEYIGVRITGWYRSVETSKEEEVERVCKAAPLAVGTGVAEADGVKSKR